MTDITTTKRRTLHEELRVAEQHDKDLAAQEQSLRVELQTLASQRGLLATRTAENDGIIAQRREAHVQAILNGTDGTKKSGVADLVETAEAIAAGQRAIDEKSKAAELALQRMGQRRAEHGKAVGDIEWRIALARYALVVRDLIPLGHELAKHSRTHGRSFMWGQGLVLDARANDIAGIPLAVALAEAEHLGE